MLTTTGIEGHPVTEYLGVVTVEGVLGVNAFKDVGGGMRNIFSGRAKPYENELASGSATRWPRWSNRRPSCTPTRWWGGHRHEAVGNNMVMVSASGTAVKLAKSHPARSSCRALRLP